MNDETYPFKTIITRKNVKNSRIRISPDCTVLVTAPHGVDAGRLIDSRLDWIQGKIAELNCLASEYGSCSDSLIYNGVMWNPVLSPGDPFSMQWPDICYPSAKVLKKNLTGLLRNDISARVEHYSRVMNVDYGRIAIRSQATRWGSCSGKGNLNFNIRAMALPENVRDYLVIHELGHRIKMNHSPEFWKTVAGYYPDFREAERELKAYWIITGRSRAWRSVIETDSL